MVWQSAPGIRTPTVIRKHQQKKRLLVIEFNKRMMTSYNTAFQLGRWRYCATVGWTRFIRLSYRRQPSTGSPILTTWRPACFLLPRLSWCVCACVCLFGHLWPCHILHVLHAASDYEMFQADSASRLGTDLLLGWQPFSSKRYLITRIHFEPSHSFVQHLCHQTRCLSDIRPYV